MSSTSTPALTMINLCNLSYGDIHDISNKVQAYNAALSVVWGPVEYVPPGSIVSAALMYIVQGPIVSTNSNELTVVIRGTNLLSLTSWKGEDFNIATTVPFNNVLPTGTPAPATAAISAGTYTGMNYLTTHLTDKNTTALGYLKSVGTANIPNLNVTGHSLGGTLTPPFYTYLCYELFGGPPPATTTCQPFSFAGLTPGNADFNTYFETFITPSNLMWRYVNPLDVAPNLWSAAGYAQLQVLYQTYVNEHPFEYHELEWGTLASLPLTDFLTSTYNTGSANDYQQPGGQNLLAAELNADLGDWLYMTQALYQHHSTTYLSLVAGS